ncbi:nucleotidyltransferase domain-containing protein [Pseudomonas sp. Q1]|uniref:nucleotidyltransferase domain-containing protein n=1 Tax=Pseudomonas sp. Q1 TaxID=2202823 RepID=UPI002115C890|nr:nucleotidyltransferase domain-containing protein [Pseudomonas sp. Q1]
MAESIDRNGFDNLIMLCLSCHKIVDELEEQYSVAEMRRWKVEHAKKISNQFSIPRFTGEQALMREINDILEENRSIFNEYGPFSSSIINDESGDRQIIWRRRCLDTLIPNNKKIIDIIEGNKRNFTHPWEAHRRMLNYKMHADAFRDNCLMDRKVNDYKTFPKEFDHFIKTRLGIPVPSLEQVDKEELEFRHGQVRALIDKFLSSHKFINNLEELNKSTMIVDLQDGRSLKVFVTHTYYFTEYTLDRVVEVDPAIDAILCSCPYSSYTNSAKRLCIERGVGLFKLAEFMGAVRLTGEKYLNYLTNSDRENRITRVRRAIVNLKPAPGLAFYLFGSHLRRKLNGDIDLMIVYSHPSAKAAISALKVGLQESYEFREETLDIVILSKAEYANLKLDHDNRTLVFPGWT